MGTSFRKKTFPGNPCHLTEEENPLETGLFEDASCLGQSASVVVNRMSPSEGSMLGGSLATSPANTRDVGTSRADNSKNKHSGLEINKAVGD